MRGPRTTANSGDLVAAKFGLSLNIRSTACTLTGDDLAVSGAPAASLNVTGPDTNCGATTGLGKSVQTNELAASDLGSLPAKLVTIQAGADDIDFANCLEYDLTHILARDVPLDSRGDRDSS